ncbi:hypothetical protein KCP70_20840 [Salmonella enterica subsp. enterica]|nr:hypothetical protein KCP70_20840 [Salmonella enterica subsp. enterica]
MQVLSAQAVRPVNMASLITTLITCAARVFSADQHVNFDSPRIVGYAREAVPCVSVGAVLPERGCCARATIRWPICNWSATIWANCNVRRRGILPRIKEPQSRHWREHPRPASAVPVHGLKGAAAYMEHAHVLGQYDATFTRSTTKSWHGWALAC